MCARFSEETESGLGEDLENGPDSDCDRDWTSHRIIYPERSSPGSAPLFAVNELKQSIDDNKLGTSPDRRSRATLVGCLSDVPAAGGLALTRAARGTEWLLVRADRIGGLSAAWLRTIHHGRLIYALRTRALGGHADAADPDRAIRLGEAAVTHDLVELEAPHDLVPDVLTAVPAARRLVTWRGSATSGPALAARIHWLTAVEAAAYQLIVACRCGADGIAPLEALVAAGRRDVVAYADGEAGLWSRVLSPLLGAPLIIGSLDDDGDAGEPCVARLVDDFGLPDPGPARRIFGIVGDPVSHSLSPRLHNAYYRAVGVPALFLPFQVAEFGRFWEELVISGVLERLGLPLEGLTVSSPHKEMALEAVSTVAPAALRAGSANLVYRRGGQWVADTTDPAGVLETLAGRGIAVAGRRAAVVGCGGSGRAVAAALARAGANVVLSNRSRIRGEWAAPARATAGRSGQLLRCGFQLDRECHSGRPYQRGAPVRLRSAQCRHGDC